MIQNKLEWPLFEKKMIAYRDSVNAELIPAFLGDNELDVTKEAAIYSLTVGGKRLRPILMLSIGEMFALNRDTVLPFALAIEMIHTYSLIHDDLPCMDNDDMRRGNPTCHVKFGEAIALLAGDALLNRAYEYLLYSSLTLGKESIRAASFLAEMAGSNGMIAGQTLDMESEGHEITPETLERLHRKKTGCLLEAAVRIPYLLTKPQASQNVIDRILTKYARHIGLAFQMKDDILDVTSSLSVLGKSIGKDQKSMKSTYVTLYGLDRAKILLENEMQGAFSALEEMDQTGLDTSFLYNLTQYLLQRSN